MSSGPNPAILIFPTGTDTYYEKIDRGVIVSGESHQIPFTPAYEFYLDHVPQTGTISTLPAYVEVTGTPTNSQFQVVYTGLNAGLVTFNGIDAGTILAITYTAYGDLVQAEWFNSLQTSVVNIEDFIGTGLGITGLYLHVTGGNVTGDVVFNGANLLNASSGNSNIGGPANTFGNVYANNVKTLNTQNAGGTNIISYNPSLSLASTTGVNVTAPNIVLDGAIKVDGSIVPLLNATYDLGSTGSYFNNIYVSNIDSPGLNGQFVAKSGDSMTGDLTVDTQIVTDVVTNKTSSLSLISTGSMTEIADGTITMQSSNGNVSITSPLGIVDLNGAISVSPTFTTLNSSVVPISPSFINLGSSGVPFGDIYANRLFANGLSGNFVNKSGDSMSGDLVVGTPGASGNHPFIYVDNISALGSSDDLGLTGRQITLNSETSVRFLLGPTSSNNLEVALAGIYVGQDVIPVQSGVINLGSTSSYYKYVYADNLNINSISSVTGVTISSGNVILGSGVNIEALLSGLNNIGSSGNPIGTLYVDTIITNASTGTYVQKAGDTMVGALTMAADILAQGSINIGSTGTPIDTLYVDNIITTTGSGTYVLKAGDTMTGALYTPVLGYTGNLAINGVGDVVINAGNEISLTSSTGIIFIDANAEIDLLANSVAQMTISQTGTQLSNNIFPDTSGSYTVGTPQRPFGAIYADTFYATATSGTGNFVLKIGDTMNGTLNFNSGIGITASNSGTSDIGSLVSPFNNIYANNIYSTNPSSAFVHITGDVMTGPLTVGTILGNSNILGNTLNLVSLVDNVSITATSGMTIVANGANDSLQISKAGAGTISISNSDITITNNSRIYLAPSPGSGVVVQDMIIPAYSGNYTVGSSNYPWSGVYAASIYSTNFNPLASGTGSLGTLAAPWSGSYIKNINGYPATTQVYSEVPTGLVDGINNIFTTTYIPISGTERLYRAGLRQSPAGVDYTITTNTITFVVVPNSGDNILVDYERPIY